MKSVLLCVALLLTSSLPVAAQTTTLSDILEQAAYQQDTANNPERAIALYRQVIESEKATREMTAQALYNTGLCYAKLKRSTEADQAFGAVVSQFKNVEPYFRLANAQLGGPYSPTLPRWQDGERLEYEISRTNTGEFQQYNWTTTTKVNWNGRSAWKTTTRAVGNNGLSMTIADERSLRPLYSRAYNPQLGHATATWTDSSIEITRAGQEGTTQNRFDGVVYDGEQQFWLMRQIPMSVGTKTKSLLLPALLTEKTVPSVIEVSGEEQIQVPAGQFNAYKLTGSGGLSTIWIDKGPERYLLKIVTPVSTFQLKRISTVTPGASRKVTSNTSNFGITIPDEWFNATRMGESKHSGTKAADGNAASTQVTIPREEIYILDDDTKIKMRIFVSDIKPLQEYSNLDLSLAGRAADGTEKSQSGMSKYVEREGSKIDRLIANLPAISTIADYQERSEDWVIYSTYVLRDTKLLWITCATPKGHFNEAKPTLDRMLNSMTF